MNKFFYYLLPLLFVASFSACQKEKEKEPDKPKPEEVTYKLTLEPREISLYLDETATIKPTLTPAADNATFTFKSDDEEVAVVNAKGVVSTGGTYGDATITIRAMIGDEIVAQARCEVEVVKDKLLLNESEVVLLKGNNVSLTANLERAEKDVTTECEWKSSNNDVATVKNGKIEAVDKGECDITATFDGVSSTCHVVVALDILLISETELVLLEGGTATLTTKLENADKDVTSLCKWESTDAKIATVDKGFVTTLLPGECDIKATYDDQTVVCHLTVTAYLTVTPKELELLEGDTQQLTANMEGVQYKSNNTSVASVTASGLVTAVGEGQTIITASCQDMNVEIEVKVTPVAKSLTSSIPSHILVSGYQSKTVDFTFAASQLTVTPNNSSMVAAIKGVINWDNGSTTTMEAVPAGWNLQLPPTGSDNLLNGTIQWSVLGAGGTPITVSQKITLLAYESYKGISETKNHYGTMGMNENLEFDLLNLPSCTKTMWNQYIEPFISFSVKFDEDHGGATVTHSRDGNAWTISASYLPTPCGYGASCMRCTSLAIRFSFSYFNGERVQKSNTGRFDDFYSSVRGYHHFYLLSEGLTIGQGSSTVDFSTTNSVTEETSGSPSLYNTFKDYAGKVTWEISYYTDKDGLDSHTKTYLADYIDVSRLYLIYHTPRTLTCAGKTVTISHRTYYDD